MSSSKAKAEAAIEPRNEAFNGKESGPADGPDGFSTAERRDKCSVPPSHPRPWTRDYHRGSVSAGAPRRLQAEVRLLYRGQRRLLRRRPDGEDWNVSSFYRT